MLTAMLYTWIVCIHPSALCEVALSVPMIQEQILFYDMMH